MNGTQPVDKPWGRPCLARRSSTPHRSARRTRPSPQLARPHRVRVEPDLLPCPAIRDLGGYLRAALRALQVRSIHPVWPAAAVALRSIAHRHGAHHVTRREYERVPRPARDAMSTLASRDVRRTERLIVDRVCTRCHPGRAWHTSRHGIWRRCRAGQRGQHDRNAQSRPASPALEDHHAPQSDRRPGSNTGYLRAAATRPARPNRHALISSKRTPATP